MIKKLFLATLMVASFVAANEDGTDNRELRLAAVLGMSKNEITAYCVKVAELTKKKTAIETMRCLNHKDSSESDKGKMSAVYLGVLIVVDEVMNSQCAQMQREAKECEPGIGLLMQKIASAAAFADLQQKEQEFDAEIKKMKEQREQNKKAI